MPAYNLLLPLRIVDAGPNPGAFFDAPWLPLGCPCALPAADPHTLCTRRLEPDPEVPA